MASMTQAQDLTQPAPMTGAYGYITQAQVALVRPDNPDYFDAAGVFQGDDNDMAVLISKAARKMRRAAVPLYACYLTEQLAGPSFFTATWEQYQAKFAGKSGIEASEGYAI